MGIAHRRIVHIPRNVFRAIGSKLIEPIDHFGIPATLIDEAGQTIAAVTPALVTSNAQHIELADEISEYDCAFAGHAPRGDKLGLLWLLYPLAVLADERTDAGAFRQAFSIQNTVRERLTGHHEKHEDPYRDEVVSAFHLNAPLHCLSDVWRKLSALVAATPVLALTHFRAARLPATTHNGKSSKDLKRYFFSRVRKGFSRFRTKYAFDYLSKDAKGKRDKTARMIKGAATSQEFEMKCRISMSLRGLPSSGSS